MTTDTATSFNQLNLNKSLLKALDEVGYETPSPIQAETIPLLLQGRDIIGQAQTGTGKTAAFALPLLSNLDLKQKDPQVLVLAPTRELAIQVAEAFQKYARHLKGFHVLPVYGGQDYRGQISALKRGVHVVVGTPGRVMDHMRRGTLKLDSLQALVLDEADEMLRMGFIDDVEWVLEQTPDNRQIALFSATMPQQIRHIATKYLNDPEQITIKMTTATADMIRQRFWPVSGTNKLDALTRILEAEEFDAMIIFVRTKNSTVELADRLEARGYAAAAINGDIQQSQRERSIQQLKNGKLDILVATDVAARGLDVPRISHVLNYDIPHDTESYVHRIGRTGRAGRNGDAILFVAPREKRLLHAIERATKKSIEMMELPSTQLINDQRIVRFKQRISESLEATDLSIYHTMVEQFQQENDVPPLQIAAALAFLLQGDTPFLLQNKPHKKSKENWDKGSDSDRGRFRERFDRDKRGGRERSSRERDRPSRRDRERPPERASRKDEPPGKDMARYRIEVGHDHEVKPGNIMGAIANEAGLDSKNIGRIAIHDNYSLVDLPDGMPKEIFNDLKTVWVSGQQLKISRSTNERSGSRNSDDLNAAHSGKNRGKPRKTDKNKDRDSTSAVEKKKLKKKKKKNKDKGKPKKKDTK
ncbi:MAG TPA: DEAD/DEAH box helicase [Gammaproteobacteria bacterium]|nr:DEAD/DEAH box helicase [Gammaproteobacteria bacterium]